jgi:hypothetical protein
VSGTQYARYDHHDAKQLARDVPSALHRVTAERDAVVLKKGRHAAFIALRRTAAGGAPWTGRASPVTPPQKN